jgi:hypothetical protein
MTDKIKGIFKNYEIFPWKFKKISESLLKHGLESGFMSPGVNRTSVYADIEKKYDIEDKYSVKFLMRDFIIYTFKINEHWWNLEH